MNGSWSRFWGWQNCRPLPWGALLWSFTSSWTQDHGQWGTCWLNFILFEPYQDLHEVTWNRARHLISFGDNQLWQDRWDFFFFSSFYSGAKSPVGRGISLSPSKCFLCQAFGLVKFGATLKSLLLFFFIFFSFFFYYSYVHTRLGLFLPRAPTPPLPPIPPPPTPPLNTQQKLFCPYL
jgi:hypothetical protein